MSMSRSSKVWIPVAAGPVLLAVAVCAVVAGPSFVSAAFWPRPDTNVAEAALLRDSARVRALAGRGAALDRRYPIRAGLAAREPMMLTTLEAARQSGSEDMVRVVVELTAAPDQGAQGR